MQLDYKKLRKSTKMDPITVRESLNGGIFDVKRRTAETTRNNKSTALPFLTAEKNREITMRKKLEFTKRPPRIYDSGIKKIECENIIKSCNHLAHHERYENYATYKNVEKEQVMVQMRNDRLNELYKIVKECSNVDEPSVIRKIFEHKVHAQNS